MNNYFDDLYNEVYEYTYDTIGGGVITESGNGKKLTLKKVLKFARNVSLAIGAAMVACRLIKRAIEKAYEKGKADGYKKGYKKGTKHGSSKTYNHFKRQINGRMYPPEFILNNINSDKKRVEGEFLQAAKKLGMDTKHLKKDDSEKDLKLIDRYLSRTKTLMKEYHDISSKLTMMEKKERMGAITDTYKLGNEYKALIKLSNGLSSLEKNLEKMSANYEVSINLMKDYKEYIN